MKDTRLHCPQCDYNLTGIRSWVCPECGAAFDPTALGADPELSRAGTPLYECRGFACIPATVRTLLLMLFRPDRFARRLRMDEPLGPAVFVLLLATTLHATWLVMLAAIRGWQGWWHPPLLLTVLPTIGYALGASIVFAALSTRGASRRWHFRQRLRVWFTVAAYSTILAPLWIPFCAPTRGLSWHDYTCNWPVFYPFPSTREYLTTTLLLWMTLILASVLWQRNRPRWLAIILMLPAFLFVRGLVQYLDGSIIRLAR